MLGPERLATHVQVRTRSTVWVCLRNASDPRPGSSFAGVNGTWSFDKIADRAHAYLTASVEHLILWADGQVPLKSQPEQSARVTPRPSYTLAGAAFEPAVQAVWLMKTT